MEACLSETPLRHVGVRAVEVYGADQGANQNADTSAEVGESCDAVLPAVREETVDGGGSIKLWNCDEVQEEYAVDANSVRISLVRKDGIIVRSDGLTVTYIGSWWYRQERRKEGGRVV